MLIYRSFYEAIQDLEPEQQALVWKAVFELGLNGNLIELKGIPNTVFKLIRPQIEANIKRFQNGKIPKQKQIESKTEANEKQTESKSEANKNNNNNTNLNKTISERQDDFYNQLTPFVNTYSKQMLRQFFDYWTEHGVNDKKMRFEKEKSFGISRRLATWKSNDKSTQQITQTESDDRLLKYVKQQSGKI